jgi:hypothetical protein
VERGISSQAQKENNCKLRSPYLAKISFVVEGETKNLP